MNCTCFQCKLSYNDYINHSDAPVYATCSNDNNGPVQWMAFPPFAMYATHMPKYMWEIERVETLEEEGLLWVVC